MLKLPTPARSPSPADTLKTCGTGPNLAKSRFSHLAGQSALCGQALGTGLSGSGRFEKLRDGTNQIRDMKTFFPNVSKVHRHPHPHTEPLYLGLEYHGRFPVISHLFSTLSQLKMDGNGPCYSGPGHHGIFPVISYLLTTLSHHFHWEGSGKLRPEYWLTVPLISDAFLQIPVCVQLFRYNSVKTAGFHRMKSSIWLPPNENPSLKIAFQNLPTSHNLGHMEHSLSIGGHTMRSIQKRFSFISQEM
jgi:hypothetical protein